MSFAPKLSALPDGQRALWSELKQVPRQFVLYGGTALALRLGHGQSVDFDFFADAPVQPDDLLNSVALFKGATVRQKSLSTLTVIIRRTEPVKLSFFGLTLRRVNDPEPTDDAVMQVASMLDIAACKMADVQQRAEAKDYLDIYALLKNRISLKDALGAAQAVYGGQFYPMITLRALASFRDGDLKALPDEVKQTLSEAAANAETIENISSIEPLAGGLCPTGQK